MYKTLSTVDLEKKDSFGERSELDCISINTDHVDVKVN